MFCFWGGFATYPSLDCLFLVSTPLEALSCTAKEQMFAQHDDVQTHYTAATRNHSSVMTDSKQEDTAAVPRRGVPLVDAKATSRYRYILVWALVGLALWIAVHGSYTALKVHWGAETDVEYIRAKRDTERNATFLGRCVIDPTDIGCKERIEMAAMPWGVTLYDKTTKHMWDDICYVGTLFTTFGGLCAPGGTCNFWLSKILDDILMFVHSLLVFLGVSWPLILIGLAVLGVGAKYHKSNLDMFKALVDAVTNKRVDPREMQQETDLRKLAAIKRRAMEDDSDIGISNRPSQRRQVDIAPTFQNVDLGYKREERVSLSSGRSGYVQTFSDTKQGYHGSIGATRKRMIEVA